MQIAEPFKVASPVTSFDRSPMKSEGSTADDSDPELRSSPELDHSIPAPWRLPNTALMKDLGLDLSGNPSNPIPSYFMNGGGLVDETQGQLAAQWLQSEMVELVEMMCHREAEMHQLEWQLQALANGGLTNQMPIQNPTQRAGLDAQIFHLQSQLNQIVSSLRIKQLATHPMEQVKISAATSDPQEKFNEDDVLTVMMRNIPNKYTQRMLIDEINENGFDGAYDFLYLPIDKESGANKGYAFLNFVRPNLAYAFKLAYDGKQMAQFKSNKIVSVAPATIQGFDANYGHFSRTRVNYGDVDSRPLFLKTKKGKAKTVSNGKKRQADMTGVVPGTMSPMGNMPMRANVPEAGGFCPFCGTRRAAHFIFCQGCGTKF